MRRTFVESMEERILLSRPLGIDVSSYQGNVNWTSAYNGGVRFAIVKATEGSGYTNPYFSSQINGATDASIVAGAYDFADFNTVSATTEANHFLSVAGNYVREGYIRPVLDMEGSTSMSKTQVSNYVKAWASAVYNATGVRTIVYASQSFAATYFDSTVPAIPSQFWDADYNGQNLYTGQPNGWAPYSKWTMWQVSSTGSIPGVTGNCDLDTWNGSGMTGMITDVVSTSGAKFTNGEQIHVTASGGQTAWDTYTSNGTSYHIPYNETGTVVSGTPVFIRGYERIEVKWNNLSINTWCADNLEAGGAGAAAVQTATATPTLARPTTTSPFSTSAAAKKNWLATV